MALYKYYQLVGGNDPWHPCRADEDLSAIKPTFETVLALDTLLESEPDRETLDRVKYLGPLYFDLDADDIADSIEGGKQLLAKLRAAGLHDSDLSIFLSGKKGLHFIVPPLCFMEKPNEPVVKLPAIYKEIAFKLAVQTLDFKVYTSRKGRMLRTCYNQRENGLYRVPVTVAELEALTPESYAETASAPRHVQPSRPAFSARFSLVYTAAQQKISAQKTRKPKPMTPEALQADMGSVNKLLRGDVRASFNKIAIQLALYAREVGWTDEQLVAASNKLIANHESDGSRYNTPARRAGELRRMHAYIDDNAGYTYSSAVIRNMARAEPIVAEQAEAEESEGDAPAAPVEDLPVVDFQHRSVRMDITGVYDDGGEAPTQLSRLALANLSYSVTTDGSYNALTCDVYIDAKKKAENVVILLSTIAGAGSWHAFCASYGSAFTGSDNHARALTQALRGSTGQASTEKYSLTRAGLDFVQFPKSAEPLLQAGFLAWVGAGEHGVLVPDLISETGATFTWVQADYAEASSDLMSAPHLSDWLSTPGASEAYAKFWESLFASNKPETLGLLYGWVAACHYRPLLFRATGQFPLLHIAGAAGFGKTDNTMLAMKLHHYRSEPPNTTPNSTAFAFSQLLTTYSSTPVLLDEFKPHRMAETKLESFRALFRDLYNGKTALRGGGNAKSSDFRAMSRTETSAPVAFIAEALETETAIVERMIPVTFTKGRGSSVRTYDSFKHCRDNAEILSITGKALVNYTIATESVSSAKKEFERLFEYLRKTATTPDERDPYDTARARSNIKERPLNNFAVVLFGLRKLQAVVASGCPSGRLTTTLHDAFVACEEALNSTLVQASAIAVPEFVKFMADIKDCMDSSPGGANSSVIVLNQGGVQVIAMDVRRAFSEYRSYCRSRNLGSYYANVDSLDHAIKGNPAFVGPATGPGARDGMVAISMEELISQGMPPHIYSPGRGRR